MRSIDEYSAAEWAVGRPLVHAFKRARNSLTDRLFRSRRPRELDHFLADLGPLAGKTVVATIAYNSPWVIDLMTRLAARNLAADVLFVVDNSDDAEKRRAIERVCRDRGVPYLGLPRNPEWHPCRSHGIALNWTYYNVLRVLRPRVFSFVDHDILLLERLDPAAALNGQPFYGPKMLDWDDGRYGWYVWPGYCMYAFDAVAGEPLNFSNEMSRRFDTGGANWEVLYRRYDDAALHFADRRFEPLIDPLDGSERMVQLIDDSLHVRKASSPAEQIGKQEPEFYDRIVRAVEEGARLADLRPRAPKAGGTRH